MLTDMHNTKVHTLLLSSMKYKNQFRCYHSISLPSALPKTWRRSPQGEAANEGASWRTGIHLETGKPPRRPISIEDPAGWAEPRVKSKEPTFSFCLDKWCMQAMELRSSYPSFSTFNEGFIICRYSIGKKMHSELGFDEAQISTVCLAFSQALSTRDSAYTRVPSVPFLLWRNR